MKPRSGERKRTFRAGGAARMHQVGVRGRRPEGAGSGLDQSGQRRRTRAPFVHRATHRSRPRKARSNALRGCTAIFFSRLRVFGFRDAMVDSRARTRSGLSDM